MYSFLVKRSVSADPDQPTQAKHNLPEVNINSGDKDRFPDEKIS
jgi:hypothetical protein